MKSIETISSEKHMLNNSNDDMHTKIRTSAPNVNRLRTPNNALSSTARSLPSRRNTSKMSRNSLGKLLFTFRFLVFHFSFFFQTDNPGSFGKSIKRILDILNPTLYQKVKSIEIELGASDDEDILDKSIKVQTALPSRKQ